MIEAEVLESIESPQDITELDELVIPDWMGILSPHYLETTFRLTLRIWEYLQENDIDGSNYSAKQLDEKYRDDLTEIASGLNVSTMQFTGAASAALYIHTNGFSDWYWNRMEQAKEGPNFSPGNPKLSRKWTLTINPTMDDQEYGGEKTVRSHIEQQLFHTGVDETIEWIENIIEQADEVDQEIRYLTKFKQELQNNEFEPKLVVLPQR